MGFTAEGTAAAEERVRSDLERIVAAVRAEAEADPLLAVVLLGGYARGEGAVREARDGTLRGFNDYDLLLVFSAAPRAPERFQALSRRLARELEIDFVDLGLATPADLDQAPPTLFWYELGQAHRVLWSRPGTEISLPRIALRDLDPAEGTRLLLNRGLALLWAGWRLWREGMPGTGPLTPDEEEVRFAAVAAHKAVLAGGDAALLRGHAYSVRQDERVATLEARPELWSWAEPGFLDAYRKAAAFRRRPVLPSAEETGRLWWEACRHHEAALRAAEEVRLGSDFGDWSDYRRLLAAAGRKEALAPRQALRRLRRLARGDGWATEEERLLASLTGLLYEAGVRGDGEGERDKPDESAAAAWREEVERVIRRWHP